jgi:hypothetical protein
MITINASVIIAESAMAAAFFKHAICQDFGGKFMLLQVYEKYSLRLALKDEVFLLSLIHAISIYVICILYSSCF